MIDLYILEVSKGNRWGNPYTACMCLLPKGTSKEKNSNINSHKDDL